MGCNGSQLSNGKGGQAQRPSLPHEHVKNIHPVNDQIKVHSVISGDMDYDHKSAMMIPLGEVSDEQLLAEVARRHLDIHTSITDAVVKESYEFGELLGHGASGEVRKVKKKNSNSDTYFACKVVKKDAKMNDAQSMSTEIEIMKRIRHKHVVSMYELYETPKCLWIILELVDGGDLFHYLASTPTYTEANAALHMKQMLQGVHYLHSLGVVHRDLKLDNILLKGKGAKCEVKIADFGLSALVRLGDSGYDPEESSKRKRFNELHEMWGTKEYFAPELIDQNYGPQADVWALGCILYEMLCGHQAFPQSSRGDEDLYSRIKRGDYDVRNHDRWGGISHEAKTCISYMLTPDPSRRLSASELLNDPWVTGSSHTAAVKENPLTHSHEYLKQKLKAKMEREAEKEAEREAARTRQGRK